MKALRHVMSGSSGKHWDHSVEDNVGFSICLSLFSSVHNHRLERSTSTSSVLWVALNNVPLP